MKKLFVVLVASFSGFSANAQYLTFGSGVMTCGQYIESRKNNALEASLVGAWLAGYLTRYSRDNGIDALSTDVPSMLQWIQNYCEENPLRNVAYAAARLTVHFEESGLITYLPPEQR